MKETHTMIEAIKLQNLGTVNKNAVTILWQQKNGQFNEATLYFSYETIVGVRDGTYSKIMVSENEWSTTTGKLLNELEPDKKARYPHENIMTEAQRVLRKVSQ